MWTTKKEKKRRANPAPTAHYFIQLLEFLLSSFMHSETFYSFHLLVPSPAFLLVNVRLISPHCLQLAWQNKWLFGLLDCKGGKVCKQTRPPSPAVHASSCAFGVTVSDPRWTEGKTSGSSATWAFISANPRYTQTRLRARMSVSWFNGDAAGVTELPKVRYELSTVKAECHTLWQSSTLCCNSKASGLKV